MAGEIGLPVVIHCREAVDDLSEAARSEDPMLRRTALDALVSIGDEACIPALVELLGEVSPKERREVVQALRQIAHQPFGENPDQWRQWWEERNARSESPT